ncbi:hypothetical protein ACHAWU_001009 [Discostella pseudostelligera]|uniref:Vacuolar protein sorting-associated protein 51 homolog n=1 Tax=Discostella pseudostelligera TaxID=259834 RepID=A0ABD3MKZ9_9STRA
MTDDDDDSSFNSHSTASSDDDFLTSGGKGGSGTQQDREALVRKKLLESFYGASSSIATPGAGAGDDEDEADGDGDASDGNDVDAEYNELDGTVDANDVENSTKAAKNKTCDAKMLQPSSTSKRIVLASTSQQQQPKSRVLSPSQIPLPYTATKFDLDSPNFNPKSHALSHIAHSTTQTLLETNERLALDIRTLDSTMQTLVYENYSKFIDATDAIKSIGTNVSSVSCDQQHGLDRLVLGMERIQAASTRSEELLRHSRDAVAEKIRIQRLLTRLDALLSLPQTLRTYIRQEKYSMAVQSHMNATEILGKHSAGFESLRSIELECGSILTKLVSDLKGKLLRWSGDSSGGVDDDTDENGDSTGRVSYGSALDDDVASRPKSIGEIFECARTLIMLLPTPFSPGLERRQCQSLTLAACGLFLSDRLVVGGATSATSAASTDLPSTLAAHQNADKQGLEGIASEIPLTFLDGILESTTLFGVSFQGSSTSAAENDDVGRGLLGEFVSTNFDKFMCHVRALLIQRSDSSSSSSSRDEEEESKDDANFLQLSIALSHLLRSVRGLASGLALPEVGIDVSLSSAIVDQTVELAEMLVTRRIAMKFHELRAVVITECLSPLVKVVVAGGHGERSTKSSKEPGEHDTPQSSSLVEIVQLASVALSDGLQMADDFIRATLQRSQAAGATSLGATAPVDLSVIKLAVQKSAKLFGVWLASALEMLVGCEGSQDDKLLLEILDEESEEEKKGHQAKKIIIPQLESQEGIGAGTWSVGSFGNSLFYSRGDSSVKASVKKDETFNFLSHLLVQLDKDASDLAYSNFLLAICEMCRLAERSMTNTLNQSIQSAMDDARVAESAKKLFGDTINVHRKGKDGLDSDQILPQRFKLAASRALAMYIINRGAYAASELCSDMFLMSDARDPYAIPSSPRDCCIKVFEIVKASCEDCISIVGGDLFVAPVSSFPEEFEYVNVFGNRLVGGGSATGGTSSGLQLDVERMFIEKSKMYPHSLDQLEFTRNSVVSGILRVSLFAFLECVRSSVFSSLGYRQMKVDAVFLRYIIPHFVKDEFGTSDQNACSCLFNTIDDIMLKAGQRCFDHEVTNDDEYYDVEKDEIFTPYQLVQRFCEAEEGCVMNKVAFSSFK